MSKKRIPNGFLDEIPEAYCGEPEENVADTVIAPRYQMRYEQLVNTPVLDRIPYFHDREIEYILEVSKAEQENVALRAKMQQIDDWCEAYPLDVFTEPDMAEVRKLLGDTLLTQLSAHNFRHVLNGVKQIAARGREGE